MPIRYADFHDVPRAFVVEYQGGVYFFDCAFDEEADEYPDSYRVYRIDDRHRGELEGAIPWQRLTSISSAVGAVPVAAVELDPTRRRSISSGVFAAIR